MITLYQPRGRAGNLAKAILQNAGIEFRTVMTESDEDPKVIDPSHCFPWSRMSGVQSYASAFSQKQAA